MEQYKKIVNEILTNGRLVNNRTGVKTYSLYGRQYRYNLTEGFPILTTRQQPFNKIVGETLWFLRGDSNCSYLDDNKIKLWKQWTDPTTNSIGPMYPTMFRKKPSYRTTPSVGYTKISDNLYFKEVDQFNDCLYNIKYHPTSRRHIIDLWNIDNLPDETISPIENVQQGNTALAMCHVFSQFNVGMLTYKEALKLSVNKDIRDIMILKYGKDLDKVIDQLSPSELKEYGDIKRETLSLSMYQRSWDVGAAGGWNVSQYSLILYIMADLCRLIPYEFIHSIGDVHIYEDQIPALSDQLKNKPYPLPVLRINKPHTRELVEEYEIDDFILDDYKHHGHIFIPVAT